MHLDHNFAQAKLTSNLLVQPSSGYPKEHVALARGKRLEAFSCSGESVLLRMPQPISFQSNKHGI
jgi:hypothetical protein